MHAAPLPPSEEWNCLHSQGFTPPGKTERGWDLSWRDDLPWTWKHLHLLHVTTLPDRSGQSLSKADYLLVDYILFWLCCQVVARQHKECFDSHLKHPPTNQEGKHEISIHCTYCWLLKLHLLFPSVQPDCLSLIGPRIYAHTRFQSGVYISHSYMH